MNCAKEEGEIPFFDAHGHFASTCESVASILNPHTSLSDDGHSYDVWIGSPESVKERRRKFLSWMGLFPNQILSEDSASVHSFAAEALEVGEPTLTSFQSSDGSTFSELCLMEDVRGGSMDKEAYPERECDRRVSTEGRESANTSPSSQSSAQKLLEEDTIPSRLVGIKKSVKKAWLSKLTSMTCVANKQCEADNMLLEDGRIVNERRWASRVKVECRKKSKELTALYRGQDIKAHDGSILTMKFSPDGRFLASAGEDGVVHAWKVEEENRSDAPEIPDSDPCCFHFEANELLGLKPISEDKIKKLQGASKKSDFACAFLPPKIFRISEKPLHSFFGHKGEILDVSWSKNGYLLSASVDQTVRLWRIGHDHCLGIFPHSNYVTCVQFNPLDENYFISGSVDGKVRIWSISGHQVVDWIDVRDIVTAVCYRPDGQGIVVGSSTSNCRFYNISDDCLELCTQICLHRKKKSPSKSITGFQFLPQEPSKLMVISADSQIRILDGKTVIYKYKGQLKTRSQISASLTSDGKHIVSACEDSNIYMWDCSDPEKKKKTRSFERFPTDASVAIPWCGFSHSNLNKSQLLESPYWSSFSRKLFPEPFSKGSATWPEEKLLSDPSGGNSRCHAWGMVIVTASWDGFIRSFHNYGLPIPV